MSDAEDESANTASAALADMKVAQALESLGKKRLTLAKEALALDPDCTDAYMILASGEKNASKSIALYRQAVQAAEKALPLKWEKTYAGRFWVARETRPMMQAMAALATTLQLESKLDEALPIYRKLIKLNPDDNQGIRYQLAGCLFEAKLDDELEKLFAEHASDQSAAILYTKALLVFRKNGANNLATSALIKAYDGNMYVPLFLSDVVEMPDEPPLSIGFGDDSEAIAYVMDSDYMWADTPGAMRWMADILEPALRQEFQDQEMVDAALRELRTIGD